MAFDIIGIIPAKKSSIRVPNKNLSDIAGMPLFMHSVKFAKQVGIVPVVSTDSEEVIDICIKNKIRYVKEIVNDSDRAWVERNKQMSKQQEDACDEILNDPELCVLLNDPHIKDNMELALLYRAAQYGDYDAKKEFVKIFAGDWDSAHIEACKFVDKVYGVEIDEPADVVIASCGGYPKDINVY